MRKCKLGDIIKIKHGFAFKSENYIEKGKYRLVTLGNFTNSNNFKYNDEKAVYYGSDFPSEYILSDGDLIMPLTEQVIGLFGNSAFIPKVNSYKFVLNQRVGKVIIDESKTNKYYLHYLLATQIVKKQIEARASGTKQRNVSPENIYEVEVYIPSINVQNKIGKLLYDIELKVNNNNNIIKELENMAKTIYDYWFLQYEFPNEEGRPYKSSGGKMVYNDELKKEIPEGWKVENLGNVFNELPKSTIKAGEANNGIYPFFTSGDNTLNYNVSLTKGRNCYLNTGGNAGIKFFTMEAAYSTDTWCITGKEHYEDYLYMFLSSIIEVIQNSYFAGSGLKHLQKPSFKEIKILVPPNEIITRFNNLVKVFFDEISKKYFENQELTKLRDYLLPLLMNGQVGFKD